MHRVPAKAAPARKQVTSPCARACNTCIRYGNLIPAPPKKLCWTCTLAASRLGIRGRLFASVQTEVVGRAGLGVRVVIDPRLLPRTSLRIWCSARSLASDIGNACTWIRDANSMIWHSSNFKSQGLVCRLWFKSMFYMFWCCGLAVHVLVVIWEYVLYVLVLWSNVFFMFRCITCNMNNICNRQINATLNITYII